MWILKVQIDRQKKAFVYILCVFLLFRFRKSLFIQWVVFIFRKSDHLFMKYICYAVGYHGD